MVQNALKESPRPSDPDEEVATVLRALGDCCTCCDHLPDNEVIQSKDDYQSKGGHQPNKNGQSQRVKQSTKRKKSTANK
jgi:hypothetical protein